MGFGEAIRTVFGKYATFSGRARRSEYWYFYLFSILAGMAAGLIDAVLFSGGATSTAFKGSGGPVAALLNLALLLPSLAVTVRRLHDTGHSGWLILGFVAFVVVALVGFIAALGGLAVGGPKPIAASGAAIAIAAVLGLGMLGFAIYIFVLMVSNGTPGVNKYGADPKGPNAEVFS